MVGMNVICSLQITLLLKLSIHRLTGLRVLFKTSVNGQLLKQVTTFFTE